MSDDGKIDPELTAKMPAMPYYILKGDQIVTTDDLLEWGEYMQTAERLVKQDKIGEILVSTVFLGIDHGFGSKVPVLFETMIFGGPHNEYQTRYTTKKAALEGHEKAVQLVKNTTLWDRSKAWFRNKRRKN